VIDHRANTPIKNYAAAANPDGHITNIVSGKQHKARPGERTTTERGVTTFTVCGLYTGDYPANWRDGEGWLGAAKCYRCYGKDG
jgi:hypothetical protein